MDRLNKDITGVNISSLESFLPIGMIDAGGSNEANNAARALEILEILIKQSGYQQALFTRYSLLQSVPRCEAEKFKIDPAYKDLEDIPDFIRQYCEALCPKWYHRFFAKLTENEIEIFLKNYVHAHETWGHPEGIATLVRSMLENCGHQHIPVDIRPWEGQQRQIPDDLLTRLGNASRFSTLGENFVLGKRYTSRPEYYEIIIGPISSRTIDKFQNAGWAIQTEPSEKLIQLVEFAEPFYLKARVKFILETIGFILGNAILSKSKLGLVTDIKDSQLDNILKLETQA